MKKMINAVLLIFPILLLVQCDNYVGERPLDYPETRWVSENPEMWFDIADLYGNPYDDYVYGTLISDGKQVEIRVFFDKGSGIYFASKNGNSDSPFTRGTCEFSSEKLIVTIDKERDNFEVMKGKFDKIVFIKQPLN